MPKGRKPILNFDVLNLNFVKDRDYSCGKEENHGIYFKGYSLVSCHSKVTVDFFQGGYLKIYLYLESLKSVVK